MSVAEIQEEVTNVESVTREAFVGPDRIRPGRARYRLIAEQVPVWAIVGHIGAIAGTTEPTEMSPETIAEVARERHLSETAVSAAIHYYRRNRGPIDALLEENAAE